jgi:hypothetical protein
MNPSRIVLHRSIRGEERAQPIANPLEKLAYRASLPGAFGFDQATHAMRAMLAMRSNEGADRDGAIDLLSLALPTSWMVNAKATSRAFQTWLAPKMRDAWECALDGLAGSVDDWIALEDADRHTIVRAIDALATADESASLAAATKVLAILRPQLVPLMDDAAIAFALGSIDFPETADAPRATSSSFANMLDWFAREALRNEDALIQIATQHDAAVLDAAQVLDRLLWFESWGYRATREWSCVRDGDCEAVVRVARSPANLNVSRDPVIHLSRADLDAEWVVRARAALDAI